MRFISFILPAVLLIPMLASGAHCAENPPSSALSPVAAKYAQKHEALAQRFAAKRKAMTGDPVWKALSPEAQKAKLDALDSDFKRRDAKISNDEAAHAKLQGNVEQTKAQQRKADELDLLKTQAIQDHRK